MSQKKVDYHKEQKYNRKKLVKQKKAQHIAGILAAVIVSIVLLGWVGFSVYNKYEQIQAENITKLSVDNSALSEYMSTLSE